MIDPRVRRLRFPRCLIKLILKRKSQNNDFKILTLYGF